MSVVAQWKNNAFALPLCELLPFHMTQRPPAESEGLEFCPCVSPWCDSSAPAGSPGVCSTCDAAAAWTVWPATLAAALVLFHDGVEDSCVFEDESEAWVLNIGAGTLTLNETETWTAVQPWRCTKSNVVFNPDPPDGHRHYYCVEPLPVLFDPNNCGNFIQRDTGCTVLPARYATVLEPPTDGRCFCSLFFDTPRTVVVTGPESLSLFECGWSTSTPFIRMCSGSNVQTHGRVTVELYFFLVPGSGPGGIAVWDGIMRARLSFFVGFFGASLWASYESAGFSCTGPITLQKTSNGFETPGNETCIWQDTLVFEPT